MVLAWPSILRPQEVMPHLMPMSALGPVASKGLRQVVASDAGFWQMTLTGVPIRTADQVREWRWLVTAAQGGLEDIVVGVFDCRQAPRPIAHAGVEITGIPHSDGALFSDGSGYTQSLVRTWLHDNAALRATAITVDVEIAGPIRRGMFFSINDRLYMVTSIPAIIVGGGAFGVGQRVTFDFLPPLRVAAGYGTPVEFGKPKATMRLASPDTGQLSLRIGRFGDPDIDLVEAWDGF
ncbi:hypothetical protein SAMN02745157_1533 [Kaistia soli DSM 19436]|uniref:TIGR02217 family protein n=1 Tax=Kaistia soli DSM 19436 TaxID=1122133 RepID=A0A1M4YJ24_9HYPH|nr:hypothetical protein [Kaistia soli]SHF05643.1 hypothetical protein SAMN02745157_1533 [Kaistia soli DSM 19436]